VFCTRRRGAARLPRVGATLYVLRQAQDEDRFFCHYGPPHPELVEGRTAVMQSSSAAPHAKLLVHRGNDPKCDCPALRERDRVRGTRAAARFDLSAARTHRRLPAPAPHPFPLPQGERGLCRVAVHQIPIWVTLFTRPSLHQPACLAQVRSLRTASPTGVLLPPARRRRPLSRCRPAPAARPKARAEAD